MNFKYKARDPLGSVIEGELEAANIGAASQQLRQDGFVVLELEEDDGDGLFPSRVSKSEIIYVTSQLAVMIETGITLSSALGGIADQAENTALRRMLTELKQAVESGEDFSSALGKYPKTFDKTFISLIKASEATGALGTMLDRIATYLRKELETRAKIRSAMAYPVVMMLLAICVTIFLLTFVLPKFAPLFNRPGATLPTATIIMMRTSHVLLTYWYAWLLGVAALIAGYTFGKQTPRGRIALDWVKINAPILGPMFRKVTISRSVRTLGTMIASGVPMLEALQLSSDVCGNVFFERLWRQVLEAVTGGARIHESLGKSGLFPRMLVQMIAAGEETGKLDQVLAKVSGFYDQEVDTALKTATSLIEPIMITVMGGVVGGIAMALLLPIFSLSKSV